LSLRRIILAASSTPEIDVRNARALLELDRDISHLHDFRVLILSDVNLLIDHKFIFYLNGTCRRFLEVTSLLSGDTTYALN
jgi:hypothetical protein